MVMRPNKLGQSWLLPPGINELVPKDHICNLVVAVVEGVDVSEIEKKYRSKPGNPAYPRGMLLRLMVQASIDGVWSSRKIERLTHENVIYMYLSGNEKPDFRTLCNFRKENKELIEEVFEQTVRVAKSLGVLRLGHLSVDGTKLKANASNNYTLSEEELEEIREIIERGIAIDEEEDRLLGDKRGDRLPPEHNTQEKLRKRIEEVERAKGKKLKRVARKLLKQHLLGTEKQKQKSLEKLERAEEELKKSEQNAVSLSDPEARFMENKKHRKELSYNSQLTVDHGSGLIVANGVTQDCTDQGQLEPEVEQAEENVGGLVEGTKLSGDNGYFSGANLRYLERKRLEGYIPDEKQAQELKGKRVKDSPYSKDRFEYDEKRDQFVCPHGEVLSRKGEYKYNGKSLYTYYGANCGKCPFRSECVKKGGTRVITSDGYEAERRRMSARMRTKAGKEEYKKRKETVEWPFGNIKQNLRFREFRTRGLENVRTEHNLVCTAHNLKLLWVKLGRDMASLCKIGGLVANLASKVGGFLGFHPIIKRRNRLLGLNC